MPIVDERSARILRVRSMRRRETVNDNLAYVFQSALPIDLLTVVENSYLCSRSSWPYLQPGSTGLGIGNAVTPEATF